MCVVIVCILGRDVIKLKIKLDFLVWPFSYMTKKVGTKILISSDIFHLFFKATLCSREFIKTQGTYKLRKFLRWFWKSKLSRYCLLKERSYHSMYWKSLEKKHTINQAINIFKTCTVIRGKFERSKYVF